MDKVWWDAETLRGLPGYPWLPCPICKSVEGCDHTYPERCRAFILAEATPSPAGQGEAMAEVLKVHWVTSYGCDPEPRHTDRTRVHCWCGWSSGKHELLGGALEEYVQHVLAALRASAQPTPPAEVTGHDWFTPQGFDWECCRNCGIVRRADDKNSPCKGKVRIGTRREASHG